MTQPNYQLAQINIGRILARLDEPSMAEFVANLDRINSLAEAAPGFVWRLQGDDGHATSLRPYDEMVIVNMSVWESPEALRDYAFRGDHVAIMRKRKLWFAKFDGVYTALWWVPTGHRPSVEEAKVRLAHLNANGETAYAFSFKKLFSAPENEPQPASL
ncbi:DUF3291 domain-containing protein [soil metagenome]